MKQIVKNTLNLLTPNEQKKLAWLTFFDVLISLADIGFLALLLFIIQFYAQPVSRTLPFLPSWLLNRNSLLLITMFFVFFSLKNLVGFLNYRRQCRFLSRLSSRISQTMLKKYLSGPFSNYVNVDSAIHIRKISHQPIEFSQHIVGGIQQIITQLALIIFSITAILVFKAKIFLLLLAILLPPVIVVFYFVKRKLKTVKLYMKKSNDKSLQHLQEALSGFIESNIYNKNDFFVQRYATYHQQFNNHYSDLLIAQGIPSRTIEIFALFGLFILIALSRWSGSPDSAALVTIGAFMAAAYKIIPGIVKILNLNGQINTYSHAVFDLAKSVRMSPKIQKRDETKTIQSFELKNVSFRYGDDLLFANLNLAVTSGDLFGISGLSGKGKTTILNLLLGFLKIESGEILINGSKENASSLQEYWPAIAYLKQQTFLIHDTISRNITLSEEPPDAQKLSEVTKIAGLSGLIDSFPEGTNKLVMENGKNISGGQRQRIAIARALYKEADLIILDEPFSELDEQSGHALLKHFRHLSGTGKLVILITHHKESLSYCNKVLSLDE